MSPMYNVYYSVVAALIATTPTSGLEIFPPLSDLYVVLGGPLWWTCSILNTGQETPLSLSYQWSFQNGSIDNDGTRTAYANGTLYFSQVLNSHLGQYTCTVSDSKVSNQSSALLREAYISSNVSLEPSKQSVALGEAAALECTVDGQPAPSLTWQFNAVNIVGTARVNITGIKPGHSLLQITNTTYTDSGSYTCTASHVTLRQPISSLPAVVRLYGKPIITKGARDQTVPIGYNATLFCSVISEPKATITWTFESSNGPGLLVPLNFSQSSVSIDDVTGSLTLTNVSQTRSGNYSCNWTNDYGTATSLAFLTVAGEPQAPEFVLRPFDTTLSEGDDLQILCNGTGNPTPDMLWITPDGLTISGKSQTICNENQICNESPTSSLDTSGDIAAVTVRSSTNVNGSLIIRDVTWQNSGMYTCRLVNPVSEDVSVAIVTIFYKPYFVVPPQSTTVTEGSTVSLHCQADGNPTPEISWALPHNSGLNLTSTNSNVNPNNEVVSQNGDLTIIKVNKTHNGVYTCYATNSNGSSAVTATISVSGAPYFSGIPVSQGAVEGDNVSIQCQANGNPAPNVSWYYRNMTDPSIESTDIQQIKESLSQNNFPPKDMSLLQTNPNSHSFLNSTSLRFVGVQASDAGLYVCVATNSYGSALESAVLRVITLPKFQVKPTDVKVSLGSTVMLDCFVIGIPIPTQRWVFNQQTVTMDPKWSLFINGSLSINNIQESYLGNYTCIANNQAGQRSRSAMVTVPVLPYFITPPSNVTVTLGGTATLTCRGSSPSPLEVSWYISDSNGNRFNHLGQVIVSAGKQNATPSSDTILSSGANLTQISDEGDLIFGCVDNSDSLWYMCYINNTDGGKSSSPVFLTVNDLPVIISTGASENLILGQNGSITCQSRGSPSPIISWMSPLKLEYTDQSVGEVTVSSAETLGLVTSTLRIENLQVDRDAGGWTCKACNSVGCRKQNVNLNIEGPPVIRQVISKESGNDYIISCLSTGTPVPNITYSSKEVIITNLTDGHTIVDSDLWVTKDRLLSEYSCEAGNIYGNQTVSLQAPQSVHDITVTPTSNSFFVSLSYTQHIPSLTPNKIILRVATEGSDAWQSHTFNLSANIDDYLNVEKDVVGSNDTILSCGRNIVKRDASLPENISVSVVSNGSQFEYFINASLQGVVPNTAYFLEAAVGNLLGYSQYTPPSSVKTLAQPPSPVTNVKVNVDNRTATIMWTQPAPINGLPKDTSITAELLNSSSISNSVATKSVNFLDPPQIIFSNLEPGNYNLKIFVSNQQTNTTSSVVTVAFDVYDKPPLFKTNITEIVAVDAQSVLINWTVPLNPVVPPVTGYTIEISTTELNDSTKVHSILNISEATVNSFTIRNLLGDAMYIMRVASTNNAGIGPFSEPKNVTTVSSSSDALGSADSAGIPWWGIAIIVAVIALILAIITVVVIVVHQVKSARRDSVDIRDGVESVSNEEEIHNGRFSRFVDGHENRSFILY